MNEAVPTEGLSTEESKKKRILTPEQKARAVARAVAWNKSHPELIKARIRAWQIANPEKARAAVKRYRNNNIEKVRERWRAYDKRRGKRVYTPEQQARRKANAKIYNKIYQQNLSESRRQKARDRSTENRKNPEYRKQISDYKRRWKRRQRAGNVNFCITEALRQRVRFACSKAVKTGRTLSLIGCSISELKLHLERQFKPGMSWDNYGAGGWEIDHKRPCASYEMSDPAQQRACFHYTNLQPLWKRENAAKGAKIAA